MQQSVNLFKTTAAAVAVASAVIWSIETRAEEVQEKAQEILLANNVESRAEGKMERPEATPRPSVREGVVLFRDRPKAGYASLGYANFAGAAATRIIFGYQINPYAGVELTHLESEPVLNRAGYQYSVRSTEGNLVLRPLATVVKPDSVNPYLKVGVARDSMASKGYIPNHTPATKGIWENRATALNYGAGINIPIKKIFDDLSFNLDISRHEYFQKSMKPSTIAYGGLLIRY